MNITARIVRFGFIPVALNARSTSMLCTQPAPSSCALHPVPAIEVSAHGNDLFRNRTSRISPTTLKRRGIGEHRAGGTDIGRGDYFAHQLAAQPFGIVGTDGHGRYFRKGIVVDRGSGMRIIVEVTGQGSGSSRPPPP